MPLRMRTKQIFGHHQPSTASPRNSRRSLWAAAAGPPTGVGDGLLIGQRPVRQRANSSSGPERHAPVRLPVRPGFLPNAPRFRVNSCGCSLCVFVSIFRGLAGVRGCRPAVWLRGWLGAAGCHRPHRRRRCALSPVCRLCAPLRGQAGIQLAVASLRASLYSVRPDPLAVQVKHAVQVDVRPRQQPRVSCWCEGFLEAVYSSSGWPDMMAARAG